MTQSQGNNAFSKKLYQANDIKTGTLKHKKDRSIFTFKILITKRLDLFRFF